MSDRSARLQNAQALRNKLERALQLKIPNMTSEDFERIFGLVIPESEANAMTYEDLLVKQIVIKACAGNEKSIQDLLDRLMGKPVQSAELTQATLTYRDFLLSCVEADQLGKSAELPEAKRVVVEAEVVPARQPAPRKITPIPDEEPENPETDLLADLL